MLVSSTRFGFVVLIYWFFFGLDVIGCPNTVLRAGVSDLYQWNYNEISGGFN